MKRNIALTLVFLAVVGVGTLAWQLASGYEESQQPRVLATWANSAETIAEAKEKSQQVVIGRVQKVERADDIVIEAKGEPGGEDRIPAEIVTVQIEKSCKGGKPERIQVFHTGPFEAAQEPKPTGKPTEPRNPDEDKGAQKGGSKYLDDDPAYASGSQVVLFLTEGPKNVTLGGQSVALASVFAPEGRYAVSSSGKVQAVTNRHFAKQLNGKALGDVEKAIGGCS